MSVYLLFTGLKVKYPHVFKTKKKIKGHDLSVLIGKDAKGKKEFQHYCFERGQDSKPAAVFA